MIRVLAGSLAGAIVVLAFFAVFLWNSPVRACENMRASWYGAESGNRTANGERFDGSSLTAAHRALPFGAKLRVTYRGKSVTVRINDRGPYVKGRQLDLSRAAAAKIGMINAGVAAVCVTRVK